VHGNLSNMMTTQQHSYATRAQHGSAKLFNESDVLLTVNDVRSPNFGLISGQKMKHRIRPEVAHNSA
jgi:hypothetical protein